MIISFQIGPGLVYRVLDWDQSLTFIDKTGARFNSKAKVMPLQGLARATMFSSCLRSILIFSRNPGAGLDM